MIYQGEIKKFAIYLNTSPYLAAAQVKAKTGADIVFNGTWYDNSPVKPVGNFKVDGKVLSKEYNQCLGYGWNADESPVMQWTDMSNVDNFICGYPLIYKGEKRSTKPLYTNNPDIIGSHGRTAMGQKSDGEWVFLCTSDSNGAMTPEQLQDKLYDMGCTSAMLLDGGGSSQMITPDGSVLTARTIYNYVCVWLDGEGKTETTETAEKTYLHGIDVSENQGAIDWGKAENEIDFAMIRVVTTDNKGLRLDYQAIRNLSECNRIGIPCGVCAFSYADNKTEAKAEAEKLLEAIKPYKVEYPVAFDFEYTGANNIKKKGVTPTKALCSAICHAFCAVTQDAGYYTMVYTNDNFISTHYDDTIAEKYDLWVPTYPKTVDLDKPPQECGIWQYSDKGTIAGISGKVDIDVAYRDYPTIIKAAGLNNLVQAPVIAPTEAELAAAWVKAQGISDGTRPTDTATRQEIWQMLYRYSKINGGT